MNRTLCIVALATALAVTLTGCGGGSSVDNDGLTSQAVAEQFVDAGLQAENIEPLTAADLGISPVRQGTDATHFLIPSLSEGSGGRVFVFTDLDQLRELKAYYDGFGGLLKTWAFANEDRGVLVEINGEMPAGQAKEYEQIVNGL